jgi:hypothetical protein
VLRISAKTGQGVEDVLDAIIERIHPPMATMAPASAHLRLVLRPVPRRRRLRPRRRRRFETGEPPGDGAGTRFEAEELASPRIVAPSRH